MASPVIAWIEENVKGLTFADVGGIGLDALNERVSVAVQAGASEVTMIDYRRQGFPEWRAFAAKMDALEVEGYRTIDNANLEAKSFPQQVGTYDFVHCTGILYHAPAPILMLDNLSRITRRYLITNTIIIPEVIETEKGTLRFDGSQVLFLPGLSEHERSIMDRYYQTLLGWPENRFNTLVPRIGDEHAAMPWLQTRATSEQHFWGSAGELSYSPYWWLFTRQAFRAAAELFGFKIRAEHVDRGHTLAIFCERG